MKLEKIQERAQKRRARWLKKLEDTGWSQARLARHLKVDRSHVCREIRIARAEYVSLGKFIAGMLARAKAREEQNG